MDVFTRAYIDTALIQFNDSVSVDDIHPDCMKFMIRDCKDFMNDMYEYILEANLIRGTSHSRQAGIDFWLSRNKLGGFAENGSWKSPASDIMAAYSRSCGPFRLRIDKHGLVRRSFKRPTIAI